MFSTALFVRIVVLLMFVQGCIMSCFGFGDFIFWEGSLMLFWEGGQ